jgi:hypothetical protein
LDGGASGLLGARPGEVGARTAALVRSATWHACVQGQSEAQRERERKKKTQHWGRIRNSSGARPPWGWGRGVRRESLWPDACGANSLGRSSGSRSHASTSIVCPGSPRGERRERRRRATATADGARPTDRSGRRSCGHGWTIRNAKGSTHGPSAAAAPLDPRARARRPLVDPETGATRNLRSEETTAAAGHPRT